MDQFRDDDHGYLKWVTTHSHGCVINIQRTLNPADARMHRADCCTINGQPPRGRTWTEPYIKICSPSLDVLGQWAAKQPGSPIQRWAHASHRPQRPARGELAAQGDTDSPEPRAAELQAGTENLHSMRHERALRRRRWRRINSRPGSIKPTTSTSSADRTACRSAQVRSGLAPSNPTNPRAACSPSLVRGLRL